MLESEFSDDMPVLLRRQLVAAANKIHEDFNGVFKLLAVVRDLVAHSRPIGIEEHTEIGLCCLHCTKMPMHSMQFCRIYSPMESEPK